MFSILTLSAASAVCARIHFLEREKVNTNKELREGLVENISSYHLLQTELSREDGNIGRFRPNTKYVIQCSLQSKVVIVKVVDEKENSTKITCLGSFKPFVLDRRGGVKIFGVRPVEDKKEEGISYQYFTFNKGTIYVGGKRYGNKFYVTSIGTHPEDIAKCESSFYEKGNSTYRWMSGVGFAFFTLVAVAQSIRYIKSS